MFAQLLECCGTTRGAVLLLGEGIHRAVEADGVNLVRAVQIGIFSIMQNEGAEAADIGDDGLAGFRVQAHFARQAQELERRFDVDIFRLQGFGNGSALGLFTFHRCAKLHIRPEAAIMAGDVGSGFGVCTHEQAFGGNGGAFTISRNLAREAAFGIVGAADEGAELAKLQGKLAGATRGADARITTIFLRREQMGGENFVQGIQHVGNAQFLGAVDGGDEIHPEFTQHLLPVGFTSGNRVELFFQIGREIIFHIFAEEAFQKGDDDAALVFGNEALFVHPHIAALAQRGHDGGVGGRPANAEFFHLLDEAGF